MEASDQGGESLAMGWREWLQQAQIRRASHQSGERLEIEGRRVSLWRPSPDPAGPPAPTVIFSHGFRGSSTQSTFLMKALANNGYLVFAPNHRDAYPIGGFFAPPEVSFRNVEGWSDSTYRDRADDIVALLHRLKTDPVWSASVDWSRIALAGHSLGGYTALGLAGGWPRWPQPEVKALLALSPYCAPFLRKGTRGAVHIPVMYQGGTRDLGITPSVKRQGGAFDQTPAPAYFVEFGDAGHYAWTGLNLRYQAAISYYCLAFLDRQVKGDRSADPTRRLEQVSELRSKQERESRFSRS